MPVRADKPQRRLEARTSGGQGLHFTSAMGGELPRRHRSGAIGNGATGPVPSRTTPLPGPAKPGATGRLCAPVLADQGLGEHLEHRPRPNSAASLGDYRGRAEQAVICALHVDDAETLVAAHNGYLNAACRLRRYRP